MRLKRCVWRNAYTEAIISIRFSNKIASLQIPRDTKYSKECLLLWNQFRSTVTPEEFEIYFSKVMNEVKPPYELPEEPLANLFLLLNALENKKINLAQSIEIIKTPYAQWKEGIESLRHSWVLEPKTMELSDVMKALQKEHSLSDKRVKRIENNLSAILVSIEEKKKELLAAPGQQEAKIQQWVEDCKKTGKVTDIIAVLGCAWFVNNKQEPRIPQLLAVLLFVNFNHHHKSLLAQIKTGEGKTLTVAFASAYFALKGYKVDVLSSNRDLAMDGERKCAQFFQLLNLSSAHNCHPKEEERIQSYGKTIVYGEIGVFQGDLLETNFNDKDILGNRYKNDKGEDDMSQVVLIVDEVDSMSLDKAKNVLYLSHDIEALKWIESVFVFIWVAVLKESPRHEEEFKNQVTDIKGHIESSIKNNYIFVPPYFRQEVIRKLPMWIESAFQAKTMNAKNDFVIDKAPDDMNVNGQKRIVILDKDVGVEQYSSRWSNGLSQFLELKFRRKLSVESMKAVFMSNKTFIQRYRQQLYGLTGTLGTASSQNCLQKIYGVNFRIIPTAYSKQYVTEPCQIAIEPTDWMSLIVSATREQSHRRPVLIITDTVQNADLIFDHLVAAGFPQYKLVSYSRESDEVEKHFHQNPASAGDVVVATNKGGRGTDINISIEANAKGGLHVILTYLPKNERIEEQGFGRTARNGMPGSGQFVLLVEPDVQIKTKLAGLAPQAQREKLNELAPILLAEKKLDRKKSEEAFLDEILKTGVLRLDIEEKLFAYFQEIRKKVIVKIEPFISNFSLSHINDILYKRGGSIEYIGRYGLLSELEPQYELLKANSEKEQQDKVRALNEAIRKDLKKFVNSVLKDRWAMWLDSVQSDINQADSESVLVQLKAKMDQELSVPLDMQCSKIKGTEDLLQLTTYPEQQIKLGQLFLLYGQLNAAQKCFEKAEEDDPVGVASIGVAYCAIPPEWQKEIKEEDDKGQKKKVRRHLKKARFKIEKMKTALATNVQTAERLVELTKDDMSIAQYVSKENNFYVDQLKSKLEVIAMHLNLLGRYIGSSFQNEYAFAVKEEEYEESKKRYMALVDVDLIHHNRLRREWANSSAGMKAMEELLKTNFDQSIAGPIYKLLETNKGAHHVRTSAFEALMKDSEEWWDLLKSCESAQSAFVLDIARARNGLSSTYQEAFNQLMGQTEVRLVDVDALLENPQACYGEVPHIIYQSSDYSIHAYGKSIKTDAWEYTKLAGPWEVIQISQLPDNEEVEEKKNKLYFNLSKNGVVEFTYFSEKYKAPIKNSFILDADTYAFLVSPETACEKTVLYMVLGDLEEALYKLDFNSNEPLICSERSEGDARVATDALVKKAHRLQLFDPYNVNLDLFNTPEKKALQSHWEKEKLLCSQERILVKNIDFFIEKLKQKLKDGRYQKYRDMSYSENKEGICGYLRDLFAEKEKTENSAIVGYLYKNDFEHVIQSREVEANKVLKILHDLGILKSGGLHRKVDKYAWRQFKEDVEKALPFGCSSLVDQVVGLQGEIRSYRDGLKSWLKRFEELSKKEVRSDEPINIPAELGFYTPIGFHRVLTLEEDKRFRLNLAALLVTILGALQVLAGALLCAVGIENFGQALIAEGVSDMVQGVMGMITGEFNLVDWGTQKAISFSVSMLTAGISTFKAMAQAGKEAAAAGKVLTNAEKLAKVRSAALLAHGSLTKGQIFIKTIAKAATSLAVELGGALIMQYGVGELMSLGQSAILDKMKPKIHAALSEHKQAIKAKLLALYQQKGNIAYQDAKHQLTKEIEGILRENALRRAIDALKKTIQSVMTIADSLKNIANSGGGGGLKGQLAKQAKQQAIRLSITTAVDALVTGAEIAQVINGTSTALENCVANLGKEAKAEFPTKKLKTPNENNQESKNAASNAEDPAKAQIGGEVDRIADEIANNITNKLVSLMSSTASGALSMATSAVSTAANYKIEQALQTRFERKNAAKCTAIVASQGERKNGETPRDELVRLLDLPPTVSDADLKKAQKNRVRELRKQDPSGNHPTEKALNALASDAGLVGGRANDQAERLVDANKGQQHKEAQSAELVELGVMNPKKTYEENLKTFNELKEHTVDKREGIAATSSKEDAPLPRRRANSNPEARKSAGLLKADELHQAKAKIIDSDRHAQAVAAKQMESHREAGHDNHPRNARRNAARQHTQEGNPGGIPRGEYTNGNQHPALRGRLNSTSADFRGAQRRQGKGINVVIPLSGSANEVAMHRAEANPNANMDVRRWNETQRREGRNPEWISLGNPSRTGFFAERNRQQNRTSSDAFSANGQTVRTAHIPREVARDLTQNAVPEHKRDVNAYSATDRNLGRGSHNANYERHFRQLNSGAMSVDRTAPNQLGTGRTNLRLRPDQNIHEGYNVDGRRNSGS